MANWKQVSETVWTKITPRTRLVVTLTSLGDYRAEYAESWGGLRQIGYYPKREDAQKQCDNHADGKPVIVGRRKVP